jgi:hypothetical protein
MGWFSRSRDAIDDLCESLTERWWEWVPVDSDDGDVLLQSVAGLNVLLEGNRYDKDELWFGAGNGLTPIHRDRAVQVGNAVRQCLLNRQRAKKAKFTDTANALADAIKAGNTAAAIGLADWVKENLGETQ